MADITLSGAVRSNLLSLQRTSILQGRTQERLATGLKVNSALDDPTAFFTASALNARAGDLTRLLDGVGNAVQTIKAADEGISAVTKLVESAQATARQALQSAEGSTEATSVTGKKAAPADSATLSSTGTLDDTQYNTATSAVLTAAPAGAGPFKIKLNNSADIDVTKGTTVAAQLTNIKTAVEGHAANFKATINSDDSITILNTDEGGAVTVTGTDASTFGFATPTLGTGTLSLSHQGITAAKTLTVQVGSGAITTVTFGTAAGQVDTIADLQAALSGAEGVTSAAVSDVGNVTIEAAGDLIIGGDVDLAKFGLTAGTTAATNGGLAAAADTFTVTVNGGASASIDLSTVNTETDLDAAITTANTDLAGAATIAKDATGKLVITATSDTDQISTAGGSALGIDDGSVTSHNTTRATLEKQYNSLRTQIDQLAADASFNGINLLDGDNLKVIFNEDNSSSLTIDGAVFDSEGLNISEVGAKAFQGDSGVEASLAELDTAIRSLRQQASTFGANLSVVQIRQDFTKALTNTLETGAANLTLADSNEEGANMLSLQTRQQLSSVALSLASQADQNVLRLF